MIRLTCTNCKTVLEMDDAFAGGACRCQHCGTIQTVPSHLRGGGEAAAAAHVSPEVPGKPSKTLYQKPAARTGAGGAAGSGLGDLADIVASSGLTARRLRAEGAGATTTMEAPRRRRMLPLLAGLAGALAAAIVGLVLWMTLGRGKPPQAGGGGGSGTSVAGNPDNPGSVSSGPAFCGVELTEPTVIYVIDRGSGTQPMFSYLKEVVYKSIESLGADRRFQIIFWNNGSDQSFPADKLTYATKENAQAARRALEEVVAFGQSDAKPALERAVAQKPDAIVIATGKGWDLDDDFVKMTADVTKGASAKLYTFAIGGAGTSEALKQVAEKSGGKFADVTEGQLRRFAE